MRDTLTRLKQRIESNDSLNQDDQQTLLSLIEELESEADDLQQHPASGKVCEVIDAAGAANKESGTDDDDVGLLESLQLSIQEIEAAHPRAADTLARMGNILGRMGI
ncbi:MAG: DUF4404 family protein [Verrucomicrobia bacterium]|nr:DUF4404 family protein [Verrucomicrobiota bacterium]